MAHLFPLQNLSSSTAKRKQRDADDTWRQCQSFKVDMTQPPTTDAAELQEMKKKKKKKKKHFKFKRDDEGNLFLRSISEIKRLCVCNSVFSPTSSILLRLFTIFTISTISLPHSPIHLFYIILPLSFPVFPLPSLPYPIFSIPPHFSPFLVRSIPISVADNIV